MMEKVVTKCSLRNWSKIKDDLNYWLSKTPQERIAAIEHLRRQHYGIQQDYKELFKSFNTQKVDYVIVGSYALALHGVPRFTGDLDIFVKSDPENAERILTFLKEFGFGSFDLDKSDFQQPDQVIQLGVPPVRVDLLTSLTGVPWQKADSGKVKAAYGDVPVFFLGRNEFIANKKALGRKKGSRRYRSPRRRLTQQFSS
jgi:hypothetical protein